MTRHVNGITTYSQYLLMLADEERGPLYQPGDSYHRRGLQDIAWWWQSGGRWYNSGFLCGNSSTPLGLFGQCHDNVGPSCCPWLLGISGKTRPYFIRGICKDGNGNILGGAVVYAVRASDNVMVGSVACDDRGVFECPTLDTTAHFIHSFYASGSLAGRSINTLTPTL